MIIKLLDGRVAYTDGRGFAFVLTDSYSRNPTDFSLVQTPFDSARIESELVIKMRQTGPEFKN